MTANFALSLSIEGIDLLHRAPDGWRAIGHVDISSEELDNDLANLRAKAAAVAPDGFATKLIIPADQIKFLTLDRAEASQAEVHAAVEGTTPYSLFDLVIDHWLAGDQTHIAAVARETLEEAESFADGHGFRPVAFVALPPDGTSEKEVFFGPTSIADEILGSGHTIDRAEPAVVTGTRLKVRPAPAETAEMAHASASNVQATLFKPSLFDAIIPETRSRTFTARRPVAAAPLVAERAPTVAAPATVGPAPVRQLGVQSTVNPKLVAAGIGIAAILGIAVWGALPSSEPEAVAVAPSEVVTATVASTPTESASVEDLIAAIPPEVGTQEIRPLSSTEIADPPRVASTSAAPVDRAAPQIIAEAEIDALPLPPQLPPPPPSEIAEDNSALSTAPRVDVGRVATPDEARAFYDATGVWLRAPRFFDEPSGAIALGFTPPASTETYSAAQLRPDFARTSEPEVVFVSPTNPPPPEAVFERDEDGFVRATPDGAVTPDGVIVFAGIPDLPLAGPRPELSEEDLARFALLNETPDGVVIVPGPPEVIPPLRPNDLVVENADTGSSPTEESAELPPGSVGLAALELQNTGSVALDSETVEAGADADLRPQLRPNGLSPTTVGAQSDLTDILEGVVAADATLRFDNSTNLAVTSSVRPADRPATLEQAAARVLAQRTAETLTAAAASAQRTPTPEQPPAASEVAAAPAPRTTGPVPGGVARAATIEDAIRLRDINLIGVYGRPSDRRALVRLSNGRYVRVEVGSELDGGQVVAIGDEALNYVKRGRTYAIGLPDS
ncbi:hypothetical protein [Yoonia litorea]|uniref:Type IV pilus biogenesis protein PilP n=1 Tax=Yoonia litorea TaxID=1123755 RepID=A0A1I6MGK1_9RHOB|nr:hypothetical protein [Yoonia litorea]SFS14772.1 hypothetical protein SAMN05444714_1752 [Yoonia litorea]